MNKIAIYKITNPLGKIYIGQTTNINKRQSSYRNSDCIKQKLLYNSIQKYGWDLHDFEILEFCNQENLNSLEEYWVHKYKANRCRFPEEKGLNLTDGGNGTKGIKRTPEQLINQHKFEKGHKSWNTGLKCHYLDKLIEANTTRKPVLVYDRDGVFIKEFNAIKSASKELNIARCQITENIKGKTKHAKGYIFKLKEL